MQITTLKINAPDAEDCILHMLVDNETLITVKGFGTGVYRWTVCNNTNEPGYDPKATLIAVCGQQNSDGMWDAKPLGNAMVWANPLTFAHVVMDLINNQ